MTWRRAAWVVPLTVLISLIILVLAGDWEYAWMPSDEDLLNPERGNREQAWDLWGQRITQEEADSLVERSEEHTSELQSRGHLVCRLLLEKKKKKQKSQVAERDVVIE